MLALIQPTAFNLTLVNAGDNGQEIYDILQRTPSVLAQYAPWAVILYWDSDCSNIEEGLLSPAAITALRANYSAHVFEAVKLITDSGARLAVAGPELLGEGPVGLQPRFQNKTAAYMQAYVDLTVAAVARVPHVPYINMRAAFLQAIPWWWTLWGGWVTIEGEHPNERGTGIEAEFFAEQINSWLSE